MQVFRAVMRRVTDPASRARIFWAVACWVIAAVLLVFGLGYLLGGLGATSAPGAYEVLIRFLPGDLGLRMYGGLFVLLGLAIVHGVLGPLYGRPLDDGWLRGALIGVGCVCFLVVWMFAWSWALSGVKTWQAMTYWASESALAFGAVLFAPDKPDGHGGPGRAA